jgi:DMSO/TMAO reductase YedYZ molybdopterin-dependent catalytic subunit
VAALTGIATGAVILGVSGLLAGLLARSGMAGGQPSPVLAVGGAFVDRTPPWLKTFAVDTFGTNDKRALFVGMAVVLLLLCVALGVLGQRSHPVALAGFVVLGALGAAAVLSRPGAAAFDVAPTLIGTITGLWALVVLWRRRAEAARPAQAGFAGAPGRRQVVAWGGGLTLLGLLAAAFGQRFGAPVQQVRAARAAVEVPEVPDPVAVPAAARLHVPGITPFVVPNDSFYRIDTALVVPQVDTSGWHLRVHGLVDHEVSLSWSDLLAKPMRQAMVTLTCVSNEVGGDLAGNAVWTGWPVRELLAMAGVKRDADMVLSRSVDGFTAGTPLEALTDGRNALVAIAMNGEPLPLEHGFPARLVVPGLYGYVSATKWLTDLKVTTFAEDVGYWVPRGWSQRGPIKTASRIDVPRSGGQVPVGKVAVAGVAWAQHRGISKVEVRVDDGPWQPARLAGQPTKDAWRQWVLEWDARLGSHTLTVRATDGDGRLQTSQQAPPAPNGASGWHTVQVTVT